AGNAIEAVVGVEVLPRLARQQVDRQVRRQQVAGKQQLVEDRQQRRVLDEGGDARRLGEQRIDAVGREPLEVVASPAGALAEMWRQLVADPVEHVVPDRLLEHHVAVRLEDRKSTRLNSSHVKIAYAVFCL